MTDHKLLTEKNVLQNQNAWLIIASLFCFLGSTWGIVKIGLLPDYVISLAFGLSGMLLIIYSPVVCVFLLLFSLYFPVFPLITFGSFEFSISTLFVIGLIIGVLRTNKIHAEKLFLLDWQKAVLIGLGCVFLFPSLFTSSSSTTISYIPNLVIYLLIMLI